MNFQVKWNPDIMDEYEYGTTIKYNKNGSVTFKNELMPPGIRIVKWISNPDFQANRTLLQLPLLRRNTKYRLSTEITSTPENQYFVMVRFFNRNEEQLKTCTIKETSDTFFYPENAYSYSIEVINKRSTKLNFVKIIIDDEF